MQNELSLTDCHVVLVNIIQRGIESCWSPLTDRPQLPIMTLIGRLTASPCSLYRHRKHPGVAAVAQVKWNELTLGVFFRPDGFGWVKLMVGVEIQTFSGSCSCSTPSAAGAVALRQEGIYIRSYRLTHCLVSSRPGRVTSASVSEKGPRNKSLI